VDIKRDPSSQSNAVRVMTVHGAKGLQAPLVILADATANPDAKHSDTLDWQVDDLVLPLVRPRKVELTASLKTSADKADEFDAREHWRLLYVALTRAEERLVIAGALGPRAKGVVPEGSWYAAVDRAMMRMGVTTEDGCKHYEVIGKRVSRSIERESEEARPALPDWLTLPAREEARPPRPLAPSAIVAPDTESSPPPDVRMRAAAERGKLLHSLFERLPAVPPQDRREAADRWLAGSAGLGDAGMRATLIGDALAVIDNPKFASIFGTDVLAEAPLAGVVGEQVIAGTVDRLLIGADEVFVVDFKTGRRLPAGIAHVPEYHKAQMAAYASVLRGIFPSHRVRAALLYTSGPEMIELPEAVLEAHKPGYRAEQDKLIQVG
jgi:ATP-dependent helicase/nuclease subunit A